MYLHHAIYNKYLENQITILNDRCNYHDVNYHDVFTSW